MSYRNIQRVRINSVNMVISYFNLLDSLQSDKRIGGLTHNYYNYPARFSPEFAKRIILEFTKENDWVFDTFMGGGTTIVEALANGRNSLGVDINPLSHFITRVKTTPLSRQDEERIMKWAEEINFDKFSRENDFIFNDPRLINLPKRIKKSLSSASASVNELPLPRQRSFARCALLSLGQWAIDCRRDMVPYVQWKYRLKNQVGAMIAGINNLIEKTRNHNISKNKITSRRILYLGSIQQAFNDENIAKLNLRPKLVLTSPPYPGVHILYHRWQVKSRRETPAPFWIANLSDGNGESHYNMGSRSLLGLKNYFIRLTEIFSILRNVLDTSSVVIQLVAFSDPDTQISHYLQSMNNAGYKEITPLSTLRSKRPIRKVPNRKWYTQSPEKQHSSYEFLFFHKPC
ncbi:MAG: DNA methyltransferase [Candidatus Aminicenantales bacterium]